MAASCTSSQLSPVTVELWVTMCWSRVLCRENHHQDTHEHRHPNLAGEGLAAVTAGQLGQHSGRARVFLWQALLQGNILVLKNEYQEF